IDTTFRYVTHDQTEAMTLGDRIVIMKDGYIMQVGTPDEVFDEPDNLFVAEFIGAPKMNTFDCELTEEDGEYYVHPFGAKIKVTGAKAKALKEHGVKSQKVILGVRPEHMALAEKKSAHSFECTVQVNEMMGSELHLHVLTEDGTPLIVRVPTINLTHEEREAMVNGHKIYVTFESKVMHLFNKETEKNLTH
ncbi:MAG: ABC transporter ATP-binding protein, partial [Erysipelotrichaceae bacterium]|nr:ABC transporter ATP-binding protein [Erysipelotrichaceae bacterium]